MICTEAEAKTKWCPFVRLASAIADDGGNATSLTPAHNRRVTKMTVDDSVEIPTAARCIGALCMAWNWKSAPTEGYEGRGYCGLTEDEHAQHRR